MENKIITTNSLFSVKKKTVSTSLTNPEGSTDRVEEPHL